MPRSTLCPPLCPSAIVGLELIKRAVDATVFLINLTCALITFVMTVGLVLVCHTAGQRGKRVGTRYEGQIFQQISQRSTTSVEDVGGGWV